MSVRVIARDENATETDITEGVQTLYDLVIGSMDWGSGFLTVEDARPVVHIARTCGFRDWERAQKYVDDQVHSEEQRRFLGSRQAPVSIFTGGGLASGFLAQPPEEHEHVFSSVGRCMWPGCRHSR